ncbi:lipoprotein-releasing system transmembrane subunit, LolC/LolE family [Idiomarina sp. OT37-5b]|jgi:lipoprotein-releasing system permease protein|uniref:lipoprotein-releasing ABC transporter permease subunit n=1 Tax=Idiomarina sp. OT37-5b TaxID=2100422 RepID=UPI000CF882FA|nr:lipoprotein-releasing ABC transporter permease subunit [Idiomarina sp. OT37-5b]AVJ56184.1 lipoprotein-releasing system transmembrane subunit, LolC/LolE family [Idiomarina sp. OT37-5b]
MFQPVTLFIAIRYGRAQKSSAFTRFINRFALGGIALGIMALIVVMSVMNGFEHELKQRILGAVPQVTLTAKQPLSDWQQQLMELPEHPAVAATLPLVQSQAVIQGRDEMVVAMARGRVSHDSSDGLPPRLRDALRVGQWQLLNEGTFRVILGQAVAQRLGVTVGDSVRMITAAGAVYTPFGMVPAQRRFDVVGIFALESEIDSGLVVTAAADLNRLMRQPAASIQGFQLQLTDAFDAPRVAAAYREQTDYQVDDWRQQFGQLFNAVAMEKRMMWLMLALIIAVAAFNTLSALVMVINEKRHDIAILQTIGLTQPQIRRVFLLQGSYNGIIGTAVGVLAGLLISLFLNPLLSLLGVNLMAISPAGLPVLIDAGQVILVALASLILCLVATVYPALMAAKTQPSEALRYD